LINRLLEFTLQRLREQRNIYANTILNKALNLEDYRTISGKIKGLEEAEEFLKMTYDSLVNHKDINK
jgi:hypothetical protein